MGDGVYASDGSPSGYFDANGAVVNADGSVFDQTSTNTASSGTTTTPSGSSDGTSSTDTTDSSSSGLDSVLAKAFGISLPKGTNLASLISGSAGTLTGLAALAALASGNKTTTAGYKGSIPKLTATRQQINPAAAPGQSRQYFTDTQYTPQDSASVAAAQQAAAQQAAQIQAAQQAQAQQQTQVPAMAMPWAQKAATGGIMGYAGGGDTDKDRYPTHEEAVAAFNAAYPTPKYNQPEERGPIAQAAHDLMVQFHLLPDSTPGTISPESQRASVYGTSQIGHADGGPIRMGVGGVLEGLATANNLSRLSDVPYIFDAVNSAKTGNYGDLIGSAVNAALPIGPALATYSADLNKNEDSDLNKHQYVQGHFGRTQRTWANGLAQGGRIHPGTISPESQRASVYGTSQIGHAAGGVMGYADGGSAQAPRYLQGTTDGMADKIPTSIDGKDPALLSHGEFVVPADVVSHLGNGNSDAGAEQLYKMMDKVRMARTGTKRQGKRINPDKFTPGGIAGYAKGGTVQHFDTGGSSTTNPSAGTSTSSTLSPWAGDYVTQMLGQAQALGNQSMPVYQGELAAGPSDLQNQQAAGLSQLYQTGLQPTQFTNQYQAPGDYYAGQYNQQNVQGPQLQNYQMQQPQSINGVQAQAAQMSNAPTVNAAGFNQPSNVAAQQVGSQNFTGDSVSQYMNPYLQQSLDPQIALLQQQQGISHLNNLKAQTQAGAFGGSRADVQNALENQSDQMAMSNLIGQGYNTAYNTAAQQFNTSNAANLQAQQANQSTGLQAGLANQNMGYNTGLQNAQLQQQANLANQSLAGQYGLQQGQFGQAANMNTAANQQAANLANQQMAYNTGNTNLQALLGVQSLGSGQNMQGQLANQSTNLATQQAQQAANQFAYQQQMQNAQNQAQYGLAAQQGQSAANQASANFGLSTLGAMGTAGATQQQIQQAQDTAAYNQFQQQAQYPYQQLQFQQSMLQGLPISTYANTQNNNLLSQIGGTVGGLGGLYNSFSKAGG